MDTPRSNRPHIGIFGAANSGKSTILNTLTKQEVSLVSNMKGTTTDPVYKNMEIPKVGAAVFIDTAGFFDNTPLGKIREEKTKKVIDECDLFLAVFRDEKNEPEFLKEIAKKNKPILGIKNGDVSEDLIFYLKKKYNIEFVNLDRDKILKAIAKKLKELDTKSLVSDYIKPGDFILLVMPQDEQAPKGRLILPQVQTIRNILDEEGLALCVTKDGYLKALEKLSFPPDLIITDSQIFDFVYKHCPKESRLTSFSILFASQKGDKDILLKGAESIDYIPEDGKILMLEACTHAEGHEDIGRVQIPRMLKEKIPNVKIDHFQGKDFPENLKDYDLVIMCGSCMFTSTFVKSRIDKILEERIPVTNYGMAIGKLKGILEKINI